MNKKRMILAYQNWLGKCTKFWDWWFFPEHSPLIWFYCVSLLYDVSLWYSATNTVNLIALFLAATVHKHPYMRRSGYSHHYHRSPMVIHHHHHPSNHHHHQHHHHHHHHHHHPLPHHHHHWQLTCSRCCCEQILNQIWKRNHFEIIISINISINIFINFSINISMNISIKILMNIPKSFFIVLYENILDYLHK